MVRTVRVMRGADGANHLLSWDGKGRFKPYCMSVRKSKTIDVVEVGQDGTVITCRHCQEEYRRLVAFWKKCDDYEAAKEK